MLIGDKWKIETKKNNIVLSRFTAKHSTRGRPVPDRWDDVGYYRTMHEVLEDLVELEVFEIELKDLRFIVAKIDEVKEMIREAVVNVTY